MFVGLTCDGGGGVGLCCRWTTQLQGSHIGRKFGVLLVVGIGSGVYVPCCLACEFETKRCAYRVA
jgi:hypothetical protein